MIGRSVGQLSRDVPFAGALLLAITLLGAFLRLRTLGADDLWVDEVLTLTYSTASFADLWLRPADPTPPLYFTLHKLLIGETDSAVHLRSLSAAVGIGTIPLVFLLGRNLSGVPVGLAAALFAAVNGPLIEYSQEARVYSVLFLIVVGSAWALAEYLRRIERGHPGAGRAYAAFAALAVLAVYAQFVSLFWIAAVHAVLLVDLALARERGRRARLWALGSVSMAAAVLPAFWMMSRMIGDFVTASSTSPAEVLEILREVALVRSGGGWLAAAEVVLAGALAVGLVAGLRRRRFALVVGAFALFPVLLWAAELVKPVLLFRTALLFVFAPILCWAFAVALLPRVAAVALAAAVASASLAAHLAHERAAPQRYAWQAAAAFLDRNVRAGDVVILCQWFTWPALRFYLSDDHPAPIVGGWLADWAVPFPAPIDEVEPWVRSYHPTELPLIGPGEVSGAHSAGATAWIVDSHCHGSRRAELDGFLAKAGLAPAPAWQGSNVAILRAEFR